MSLLNVIKVTAEQYRQINSESGYTADDGTVYKEGDGNLYIVYGADLTAEGMSKAWLGNTVSGQTLELTDRCNAVNGFFQTSDETLKSFGDDIPVDLDILSKIPKKYFIWKDKLSTRQIGTSAQVLESMYPELVSIDEFGKKSVDYAKLSIVALAAIDKLWNEVKILQHKD